MISLGRILVVSILMTVSLFGLAQNSCPDPDRYGIQCIGLCGTTGSTCSYTETFQTSFTGNGKYVSLNAFANGVLVASRCLGPFPSSTTQYTLTFNAPCDATIYVLYDAFTNSSSQNPCGGTVCESGFCAYDTCQEGIYLPITLEAFVGQLRDQVVDLTWTTLTETNNDFFELEKSSDGIRWQFLTAQQALSGQSGRKVYKVRDISPYPGENFYRLIQVDLDGSKHHQGMVIVKNLEKLVNYDVQDQSLEYSSLASGDLSIRLMSVSGQVIDQISLSPGEKRSIAPDVPKGIYILQYYNGTDIESLRVFFGH